MPALLIVVAASPAPTYLPVGTPIRIDEIKNRVLKKKGVANGLTRKTVRRTGRNSHV